ncbi:MAG: DsrE family protein [Methanobacterium sp.]|uniref:DsrE family protein n=1 Tax=Methanobacterium sp. TaxID=2164 RepID=UPI003D64C7A4|nr:DsrE family protein [Methanobacterium sp.]
MNSVLIIINKAPYGYEDAFSGFFVEIACLNRQLVADVVLIEDGVYAAIDNQNSEGLKFPGVGELTYLIFPEGNIFVYNNSLKERGIHKEDLMETIEIIDDNELYELSKSKEVVIKI